MTKVSSQVLAKTILQILEEGVDSQQTAHRIAAYLITERRTKDLNTILRQLEELNYQQTGQLEITATVSHPLSEPVKDLIKNIFSPDSDSSQVVIHEEIDKNTLGGVRVRALDKVADFSVRARLQRLRQGAINSEAKPRQRTGRSL